MSKGPSRRQWFLGLVGAVLGLGAARAVERLLPGPRTPTEKNKPAILAHIRALPQGENVGTFTRVEGKLEILPGPGDGSCTVRLYDPEGRLQYDYTARGHFYFYPCPVPEGVGQPQPGEWTTTYTYLPVLLDQTGATHSAVYQSYIGGQSTEQA